MNEHTKTVQTPWFQVILNDDDGPTTLLINSKTKAFLHYTPKPTRAFQKAAGGAVNQELRKPEFLSISWTQKSFICIEDSPEENPSMQACMDN
jgi:hypothetical protein